jgi:hypothetical protein
MINYTQRISVLARDVIARVPRLSYIDPDELLIFGRYGRSGAEGAFATCHCISLPPTEPGYYYWRDRQSGTITRRSHWFVTKSPLVFLGSQRIKYLISFTLPRFCDQTLRGARKEQHYGRVPGWIAKLDTIIHELYHIDPTQPGIRRVELNDGRAAAGSHGLRFLETVAEMVQEYLDTNPDTSTYDFLRYDFDELDRQYGGVTATTFRTFPSFPQRYIELLPPGAEPTTPPGAVIQPLKLPAGPKHFTEGDLVTRQFLQEKTRRLARREVRREWGVIREVTPLVERHRAAARPHRAGRRSQA